MKNTTPKMQSMFGGKTTGGFLDLPIASPGKTGNADIVIMGASSATPYPSVGPYCQNAPDAIRSAFGWPGVLDHFDFDLGDKILSDGVSAIDWGNLPYDEIDFQSNRGLICANVRTVLSNHGVPFVLGGDDSVPIPVLQAYEDFGPITIVQIDAHIDWRDSVSGESMGLSSNMRRASEMPWVKNIIQIGARGMGSARPQDYQDALDWGVQFFPMREVYKQGIACVIDAIPDDHPVFISVDIDGLDPAIVPAVIGPAPGGLSYWQTVEILTGISKKAEITGFDLVELMPENDIGGRGALVAARLTAMTIGLVSRQR